MALSRWWDAVIAITAIVAAAIVAAGSPDTRRVVVTVVALALLVGTWAAAGRRAREGDARSVVFSFTIVLTSGALVSVQPVLAIVQMIAYPLVWLLAGRIRTAVLFNVGVALSVGVGFVISTGVSPGALIQTAITVALSVGFSLAFGFWITRIATLSEERRRLVDTLTAAQAELAMLHRDAGVTSERERLARELHDTIAQSLAGLVLLSQRSRRELAAGTLGDATLELVESGAREALAETRALVAGTAPVELSAGIVAALTRLGQRVEREAGIAVVVDASVDPAANLGRDAEVVLLRCAQEGLANVRKHAGARAVRIELAVAPGEAVIRVVDDGRGFDPGSAPAGFGLDGLRDRLALIGGSVQVDGTAGATTLTARLPLGVAA